MARFVPELVELIERGLEMSTWLYPISKKAGRSFILSGKPVKVSLESFRGLVQSGRLKEDKKWYVWQNYRKIQPGDEIYIYTGDQNTGIVGYATVQKVYQDQKDSWYIELQFDLKKCKKLIDQPVPAKVVRQWVRFPRASVISLEQFQKKLSRYLPWSSYFYLKPTESIFKDLHLKPLSQVTISPKEHQRRLIHDTLLEPAADFLRSMGFKVGAKTFGKFQADLIGMRKKQIIIADGKTNERGQGRKEAREALGQLFEYRWLFRHEKRGEKLKYYLWVVFQNRPDGQVIEFLEDHQFLVSWIENKSVRSSDRSKSKFEQLGK